MAERASPGLPGIGLGCASLGNLFHPMTDADARSILDLAWERGIRYFDTAPHYGPATSEWRLGDFLRGIPRSEVFVSSKVGRLVVPAEHPGAEPEAMFVVDNGLSRRRDYSAAGIRASVESSLERLNVEYLDLAFVHDPEDHLDQTLAESIPALEELVHEGLVRHIGVGTNSDAVARSLTSTGRLDAVLLAGHYTLLAQTAPETFGVAAAHDTHVIAAGVFNSGILASPDGRFHYGTVPAEVVTAVARLRLVCSRFAVPLPAAALQFVRRAAQIGTVLLGPGTAAHLAELLDWLDEPIPEALWDELAG
jgi:D-threo-aldose 1-dehydrogenase